MTSWLNQSHKSSLEDHCHRLGVSLSDDPTKEEIMKKLDLYLQRNALRLSDNPDLQQYYASRRVKRRRSSQKIDLSDDYGAQHIQDSIRGNQRTIYVPHHRSSTTTKADQESHAADLPADGDYATARHGAGRLQGPITSTMHERHSGTAVSISLLVSDLFSHAISDGLEILVRIRNWCSSVTGLQILLSLLEGGSIIKAFLAYQDENRAIAPVTFQSTRTPVTLSFPDLSVLRTSFFWTTVGLWSVTSLLIPLVCSYVFNFTFRVVKGQNSRSNVREYLFDPLTYGVAKALLTWEVYNKNHTFGLVQDELVSLIPHFVIGGWTGMVISGVAVALARMYESMQRS